MGSDSRPVCHRCAQIKQACDGSLPCARCVRLSLPCRPRDSSGSANNQIGDMPKARIRRVQTGCLMCKRRKKKCDETKPRCGDCRRLCLDCAWPAERPKDKAAANGAAATAMTPSSSTVSTTPPRDIPVKKEPGSPPMDVTSTDIALRGSHSPAMSSSSGGSSSYSMDQSFHVSSVSNGGDFELEFAGEGLPWEFSHSPPNSNSGWFDSFTPLSFGSPRDSIDSNAMSSLSVYVPQLLPQLTSPQDRALLNHYTTIVSSILSRRTSIHNPYNNHLLPLAQSNDTVLHCILALSANHWRKLQPDLADRGMHHQSKATQALARLLPHVDKTSADIALVSSLLLCMTELFDGTSEGWKLHLKGAKKLLTTLMNQQGDSAANGHYKFLLRLAKFLDSAATVSTCRPPLMGEDEREAATLDRLTASPDEDDSAVYGIPKELFHLVDVINALADKRKTRVDRASEAAFRDEAAKVEERINNWSFEYGGMSRAAWTIMPASDDVLYATMAYEYAIRLRLHQIVEGYELEDPKVTSNVEGILDAVQKIRYGSPLEACLLFPLVMAGGACWQMEQRVIIHDRLMIMERTCGFGYIYNARDLVQRVWNMRDHPDGTGEAVNWARIRYEEMHGLVVF
ncbi:hypothetical protein PT974_03874 [Cladobotryum mycophilum]|uniref:Zn(2)-C6 fungal-type domain-containing protein n=1 Tax=Cladobotryum mycophilum TaxID=491253 RepID=A0ABR0SUP8_9HYPO